MAIPAQRSKHPESTSWAHTTHGPVGGRGETEKLAPSSSALFHLIDPEGP